MKSGVRLIFPAVAAMLVLAAAGVSAWPASVSAGGRRDIAVLWKKYSRAADSDRPKEAIGILGEIMEESVSGHRAWDFYEAGRKYVGTVRSVNWKDRERAVETVMGLAEKLDEPIAGFMLASLYDREQLSGNRLREFISGSSESLKNSRNSLFYEGALPSCPGYIAGGIRNDYEFVLWSLLMEKYRYLDDNDAGYVRELLAAALGEAYPAAAYLEFVSLAQDGPDRNAALKGFAGKYRGRAISLLAEQDLLACRKDSLDRKGSSDGYRDLRSECQAFEERRASFTGEEKEIAADCMDVSRLIAKLDGKKIIFSCGSDTVRLYLRNLDGADVAVMTADSTRTVWDTVITDSAGSYYAFDTLSLVLPDMDDGEYVMVCGRGDVRATGPLKRFSLSIACRERSGGYALYAADQSTGKPVDTADLTIMYKGDTIRTSGDFRFDGFTLLDRATSEIIARKKGWKSVVCSFTDSAGYFRRSMKLSLADYGHDGNPSATRADDCRIFLDRAAFNPGDTVRFKAVAFIRASDGEMIPFGEGEEVTAELRDNSGRVLQEYALHTNTFGSVSGKFVLDRELERNGRYSVSISVSGNVIGRTYFVADEFVLPDFSISFDENDRVVMAGDTVRVSGKVWNYSGHPMSDARVTYSVEAAGFSESGDLALGEDGTFSLDFASMAGECSWYYVTVRVVAPTGETHEKRAVQFVTTSLHISMDMVEEAYGRVDFAERGRPYDPDVQESVSILAGDSARVRVAVSNWFSSLPVPAVLDWSLKSGDIVLETGTVRSGDILEFDFGDRPSGMYVLEADYSYESYDGKKRDIVCRKKLFRLQDTDTVLDVPGVRSIFREIAGPGMGLQFGSSAGPVWAVVELLDSMGEPVLSERVFLDGEPGRDGSLGTLSYEYLDSYTDRMSINVFYFRDGESVEYSAGFSRPRESTTLPLEFVSFTDLSSPGSEASFRVRTIPDAECLVSVYDRSSDAVMENEWNRIYRTPSFYRNVRTGSIEGGIYAYGMSPGYSSADEAVPFQLVESSPRFGTGGIPNKMSAAADTGSPEYAMGSGAEYGQVPDVVRDDFRKTLTFLPDLRPDSDGYVDFSAVPSGRLSSYCVRVFAHDRNMRNAVISRDMLVSIPCRVSVVEPEYLYEGDFYRMKVSVSNTDSIPAEGVLTLSIYDGGDYRDSLPVSETAVRLSVPGNGGTSHEFGIEVPSGTGLLGLKAVFSAEGNSGKFSDGIFVRIPVRPAAQMLTEAHSALLADGMDRDSLVSVLRGRFVNAPSDSAEYREICLADMVRSAMLEKSVPGSADVLSLADAYFARTILKSQGIAADDAEYASLEDRILDCRNADGGFGWFAGMKSSPVVTAVLLEQIACASDYGRSSFPEDVIAGAVGYIDTEQFSQSSRWGGLTAGQYLHVRSYYPEIPFRAAADRKMMSGFRKETEAYLFPGKDRGLQGAIMLKARRASTLRNLLEGGRPLLDAWNIRRSDAALLRSLSGDLNSLSEYAVGHPGGGCYYPNAVMPFRGLLESELYAHTLLCRMADWASEASDRSPSRKLWTPSAFRHIADGIRLWIMLQKETQHWDEDAAFVAAAATVLEGPESVLSTKVAVLTADFTRPFMEMAPAGNGFTIRASFYRESSGSSQEMTELKGGEVLKVGEKITAVYEIWSAENRSFVKITAPRCAAFRPVDQLSGRFGWSMRPLYIPGAFPIVPQGYRNVRSDRTELYLDVLPEETTSFREEFYVTQSGRFSSPVPVVESLYAPHYRANGGYGGVVETD